jgi:putative transcriptional regulator
MVSRGEFSTCEVKSMSEIDSCHDFAILLLYMREIIHNRVAEIRQTHAVTQEELAGAVGVSRQTISALEKGNYTPSVLLALKIATHFKTSVEKLFSISYEK